VKQRTGITIFLVVVCGTLILSSWLARQVSAVGRDAYQNIEAFANVLTMVQKNYVDQVTNGSADRWRHQRDAVVA
jgi:hypothetical protein